MNDYRHNEEARNSPLKHYCNNCCRQDPPMDAELVGECLRRNRIFACSQSVFFKICVNYKGENSNSRMEKLSG